MTREVEELKREMESLVEGIEQSLMVIVGTMSETSDPADLLGNFLAARKGLEVQWGQNDWRNRLIRKMEIVAAKKASQSPQSDEALRALIARLLTPQPDQGSTH